MENNSDLDKQFLVTYSLLYDTELDFFKNYLTQIDNIIRKDAETDRYKSEDIIRQNKNMSMDEAIQLADSLNDSVKEMAGEHLDMFYSSFVICIFSYFEHTLDTICRNFAVKNKSDITLNDMKGKGIHRARLYMKKICKFTLPNNDLWSFVVKLGNIRNCLAHAGGEISDADYLSFKSYVSVVHGLKIWEHPDIRLIQVQKEYCLEVVNIIKEYLAKLDKDNRNLYPQLG